MKKILLSLSIISLLGITACQEDDFLNYEPSGSQDLETAITNPGQLLTATLGLYDGLQSNYAYGNYYITAQEIMTDNGFVTFKNSNRFTDFNRYQHAIATGGSISNMWTIGYRIIARANFILSHQNIVNAPGTEVNYAEARAIRALTLFNLVNYYARPYGTTNQELGIPVPTVFQRDMPIKRSTVEEVYNEVISELTAVVDILPQNKAKINPAAVHTLLSRVYLYKKDYAKSIEHANLALSAATLIKGDKLEDYYLNPLNNDETNGETLFALDMTALDNPGANDALYATWTIQDGRYKDTAATGEFYDLLEDGDARKDLYLPLNNSNNPLPYYGVKKFGGVDNDVVVLRATEAKLNKIEALYFTNPSQALAELVDWVKTYRNSNYSFSGSGQALLDEILKQRRIELAFEGHRYFDLNRYQLPIVKGANCTVNCEIPFADYRRVFPIPFNEMNTNSLMVQNPEYQ